MDFIINPKDEDSKRVLYEHLKSFNKTFLVKTDKIEKRSLDYNAYYWGCIVEYISEETGTDPIVVHDTLAQRFLGLTDKKRVSTASLNNRLFKIYTTQCRNWALEQLNIFIPLPEYYIL